MIYNPLFVFLQSPKWYTFGLQFGIFMRYYLHTSVETVENGRFNPCTPARICATGTLTATHEKARRIGHLQPFHGQNTTSANPD